MNVLMEEVVEAARFSEQGRPLKIYIAAPYSIGDVAQNIRNAIIAGNNVRALGHIPFVPHLTHFWHMIIPHEIKYWYSYDNEWLDVCDGLLRLEGASVGADIEVARAIDLGIPVYYSISDLRKVKK